MPILGDGGGLEIPPWAKAQCSQDLSRGRTEVRRGSEYIFAQEPEGEEGTASWSHWLQ